MQVAQIDLASASGVGVAAAQALTMDLLATHITNAHLTTTHFSALITQASNQRTRATLGKGKLCCREEQPHFVLASAFREKGNCKSLQMAPQRGLPCKAGLSPHPNPPTC